MKCTFTNCSNKTGTAYMKLTWPNRRPCQSFIDSVSFIQILKMLNKTDTAYEKLTRPTNSNTVNSKSNLTKTYCRPALYEGSTRKDMGHCTRVPRLHLQPAWHMHSLK